MLACCLQVKLNEDDREKVILATLSQIHNASIHQFIKDQTRAHPLRSIRNVYAGLEDLNFEYNGESPTKWWHTTAMAATGALGGQYSSPGFGQLISEIRPSVEYKYTAYLSPRVFHLQNVSLVMTLEVNTDFSPEVCCGGSQDYVYEQIKVSLDDIQHEKTGPGAKFTHTILPYNQPNSYYDTELSPKCEFSVTLDRYLMKQKVGQLEGGFNITWYIMDEEGDKITEVNENMDGGAYCTDRIWVTPMKPLTRWFNIILHLLTLDKSMDSVWDIVKAVKLNHLWKEGATKCRIENYIESQSLADSDIDSLLAIIDEAGSIDSQSSLSPEDLTDQMWITGFHMFSYLAYCPDQETRKWATFYTDTVAKSPLRSILEKISYIVTKKYQNPASKFGSLDLENNTLIELEVYKQISNIVSIKNVNATIGLSPSWKLLEALNNPMFASVKNSIIACLESGSCEELEMIRKSINNDEYTLAQTFEIISNKLYICLAYFTKIF